MSPLRVRMYGFDGVDINGDDGLLFPNVPSDDPLRVAKILVVNTPKGQCFFVLHSARSIKENARVFVEAIAILADIAGLHGKALN